MVDPRGMELDRPRTRVSVLLSTFNHERWITQSIESVLRQETDFDYELVILEDCSTDRTRDLVVDFQRKYPNTIRLHLSQQNGEYLTNFATTFLASPSEYIARLDGDDYWISSRKLQKQVDFLDARPECAMCFHNVSVFHEDGARAPVPHNPPDQQEITTLEDLLIWNYISGCSPMVRSGLFSTFPDWFYSGTWIDWPLYLLTAHHGKIGYIDDVMGAWRIHDQGMWGGLDAAQQLEEPLKFYVSLNADLNRRYEGIIKRGVAAHCHDFAQLKELRSTLENERQRCRRLEEENRALTLRVQALDEQLRGMQGCREA